MPIAGVTLLAGEEGIGKSLVVTSLIAQATRGDLAGELHGEPQNVYLLLPEDHVGAVVRPRLEAAGADLDRVYIVGARLLDDSGEDDDVLVLPDHLDLLAEDMAADGARLVFCDSFADLLPDELDAHQYKPVVKAMHQINEWAYQNDFGVMALWHINKANSTDSATKLMGSRGFRTASRSVLMVARDPRLEDHESGGIVVLDKANGAPPVAGLSYRISTWHYRVKERVGRGKRVEHPASCGVIKWTGETDGDGRSLLRESFSGVRQVGTARAWLEVFLMENGATPRSEVLAAGKAEQHSKSSVERAGAALKVVSTVQSVRREGKPPLTTAVWRLPDEVPDASS